MMKRKKNRFEINKNCKYTRRTINIQIYQLINIKPRSFYNEQKYVQFNYTPTIQTQVSSFKHYHPLLHTASTYEALGSCLTCEKDSYKRKELNSSNLISCKELYTHLC